MDKKSDDNGDFKLWWELHEWWNSKENDNENVD